MFLLAFLPIPMLALKSVSLSKSCTSFSSTNLLSYSSSSCTGWGESPWSWTQCHFLKPAMVHSCQGLSMEIASSLKFLIGPISQKYLNNTYWLDLYLWHICSRLSLGMNLNKPFWLCVDLLLLLLPSVQNCCMGSAICFLADKILTLRFPLGELVIV